MKALLVVLLLAGSAAAQVAPPIDEAIARAAAAKKKLVVELGAVWCAPCRDFEARVLSDPAVIAALENVVFVRYDVETPIGDEAQRRYNVQAVPTLLVIDGDGMVTFRARGLPTGATAVPWFLELLGTGKAAASPLQGVRDAVAQNPSDIAARLELGRALRDVDEPLAALDQFRAVLANPAVDSIATAEAVAAIEAIEAGEKRVADEVARAKEFVTLRPESPVSSQRLALLILERSTPREDLDRLVASHLAEVREVDRPDAVRVAVLAKLSRFAAGTIERWQRETGVERKQRLSLAEIALEDGRVDEASANIERACRMPGEIDAWCLELETTLYSGSTSVPGIVRLQQQAGSMLDHLRNPGRSSSRGLQSLDPDVANAVARAVREAQKACAPYARGIARAQLIVDLAEARPRIAVEPRGKGNALAVCLRNGITTATIPRPRGATTRVAMIVYFESARERIVVSKHKPIPDVDDGAVLLAAVRTGAVEHRGVAIDSMLDITGIAGGLRVTGSGQVEALLDGDSDEDGYAGRLLGGVALVPSRGIAAGIAIGIGFSRYGNVAPLALEVPVEFRFRATWRRFTAHVWVRGSFIIDEDARTPKMEPTFMGADEASAGAGVSFPFWKRMFTGIAYDERAAGKSALFVAGFTLGDYF
jgi:hypothetical protein